jgi:hypothetical protein
MINDEKKESVFPIPILIAIVISILAAYAFYLYVQDKSQTPLLVAVIGAVVAVEKMLEKSGLYKRCRIRLVKSELRRFLLACF